MSQQVTGTSGFVCKNRQRPLLMGAGGEKNGKMLPTLHISLEVSMV
jgi:hypothetical protein